MSHSLLSHGYTAHDADRRNQQGARVFELRRPDGTVVEEYYGPIMDIFVAEMERRIAEDLSQEESR